MQIAVSPDPMPQVTVQIDFEDGKGYQTVFSHQVSDPAPPTYKFGFSSSTGGLIDTHLIRNLEESSITELDQLNLVKTVDYASMTPYKVGDTVQYQFLVTNTGTTPLTDVAVRDPSVTDVSCPSTTLGSAGTATASMVCTGTHVITEQDSLNGTFTNTAQAAGVSPGDPDVQSNPSTARVPVVPVAAHLVLAKTASTASTEPGGKVTYTLTVANHSGFALTPAEASDDLSGVLDEAAYNGDAHASTGTVGVDPR